MATETAAQWAQQVLTDLGAPLSQNNVNNMLAWMASENSWPPPRNNPLNNGLGSGGGSGLGSYPDLATAAQYTAQGLQGGITGAAAIGQALVANAPFSTFHQATISATWSGDHYAGTDWASATSPATMGVNGAESGGGGLTAAEYQALGPLSNNPAAVSYLEAAAGGGGGTASAASDQTNAAAQAADEQINIPGLGPETVTAQQASAYDTITANLQAYGFNQQQSATVAQWAWGEITNNVDPTQVAIDLQTPGTLGYSVFEQVYPGFTAANAQLTAQGLPAVSVQQYSSYQTQAQAMAQAAGLPAGFINSQNIGTLVGGNVSTAELSSRINNALTLAYQSTPEQQAEFNSYFGNKYGSNNPYLTNGGVSQTGSVLAGAAPSGHGPLTPGQIAAIALDPNVAEPLIAQQITAAQIGGASVTSGVGALSASTASQLAQAGITESQATSAFQNLAPYATLETARPGMGGEAAQGVVTPEQLATGALLGNTGAQRQLQTAEEVAKAPFSGGGGFVQNSKGVAGAGSASDVGAGNT